MKSIAKPYRLINKKELEQLQQMLTAKVECWNETNAYLPLSIEVARLSTIPEANELCLFFDKEQALILIEKHYINLIQHCLFGEYHQEFNTVSEGIFIELLKSLLSVETIQIKKKPFTLNDWFYPGSCALHITISNSIHQAFNLYLSADWVLQQLIKTIPSATSLCPIERAIAQQKVTLGIHLQTFCLPIKKITSLQVGDVICTDHPLENPLQVVHQQQQLCHAKMGKLHTQKSIQLLRLT